MPNTGRLRGSRCFDGINREDRKSPNMKLAKIVFLDFHSLSTRIQRSGSSSPYSPNPESLLEVKLVRRTTDRIKYTMY